MAWIFQGNPKVFDIDDYLARYSELIYWRASRYQRDIKVGDRAFIWRAGSESGVVASGVVVEAPVEASKVEYPEALGDDLWFAKKPDNDAPKVGIALDSVCLSTAEGMLQRAAIKDDSLLQQNAIIRMPNATVFSLNDAERQRIEELWVSSRATASEEQEFSSIEGKLQLQVHRRRERSRFLVKKKLEDFRRLYSSLYCEVCTLSEVGNYPATLGASIFEVHHILPLSSSATPRRTTLSDLVVVCANCHRAIHATSEVENNMQAIKQLLAKPI